MNLACIKPSAIELLAQIVDKADAGMITDCMVRRSDGTTLWLIDELARELVEKHADAKVTG